MSLVTLNSDLRNFNKKPENNSGIGLQTRARVDDVSRLTKFLFTSGNGALFQARQALLIGVENIGVRKKDLENPLRNTLARVAVLNGVILGQAAASGTGLHLSSNYLITEGNYITNVNERIGANSRTLSTFELNDNVTVDDKTSSLLNQAPSNLQVNNTGSIPVLLISGSTSLRFENRPADSTNFIGVEQLETNIKKDSKKKPSLKLGRKTEDTYTKFAGSNLTYPYLGLEYNYSVRIPNSTRRGTVTSSIIGDEINKVDISTSDPFKEELDIIPFKIVIRKPGTDPFYLYFRAFLDNLSDSYDGGWNSTNYIGRAEPVYTYNSFNRKIDFGFKIAAFSRDELFPLYNKLNTLVSSTAPSYSSSFMRGVLAQVTIGDWISNIPGFFENISLDWDLNYPWELDRGVSGTDLETSEVFETKKEVPKVPHILNVRASFRPIHDFLPEFRSPFIYNSDYWDKQKVENEEKNKKRQEEQEAERIQQLRQEQQETFNRFVDTTIL